MLYLLEMLQIKDKPVGSGIDSKKPNGNLNPLPIYIHTHYLIVKYMKNILQPAALSIHIYIQTTKHAHHVNK